VPGTDEAGDTFGAAAAVEDINGDGYADVAVGAPGENIGAGGVVVLYGGTSGLSGTGAQWFGQGSPNVPGSPEQGDFFGRQVATIDLSRDGRAELIVAATVENDFDGAVTVLNATPSGLTTTGSQTFSAAALGADPTRALFGTALPAR
jgi:hypothetical protein